MSSKHQTLTIQKLNGPNLTGKSTRLSLGCGYLEIHTALNGRRSYLGRRLSSSKSESYE